MQFLLIGSAVFAQNVMSLDSCRQVVLHHNQEVLISQNESEVATEVYKSAKTQLLPSISANASYVYLNKLYSFDLTIPEINLPVGSMADDGSWTVTPSDMDNTWVAMGDTYVPLDADGQPFDPNENPEKIIFSDWAHMPETTESIEIGQHNNFVGGVSVVQPVYMGGKIRETVKMAEYAKEIASAALQGKKSDIIYSTDEAFYRILNVEEKVKLATSAVGMLEQLVKDLENFQAEGLINQNNVMKAKVKLNEAKLNQMKAENGLILSKMVLNQMMGIDLHSELILDGNISDEIIMAADDDYVSNAIQNRYEIKALEGGVNIAGSEVKIAKSRFLPNIAFSANYLMMTPNPYDSFSDNLGADWNLGVVCNIPLFHWNDRIHTLRAAEIAQESAGLKLSQATELISLEVEQSKQKLSESARTIVMATENLEQATENLRINRENLNEGMSTVTDVLEAQLMWQKAQEELINARTENHLSYSHLEKVSGKVINN